MLDFHSHRPAPYPEGIISLRDFDTPLMEGQLYSAGIHPWDTGDFSEEVFTKLALLVESPQVVAIGECGLDPNRGAPMFRQLQVFRRQMELSERVGKPLVIHAVKASDIILGLKRDLNPAQPWIIHGFRGKPGASAQLAERGIYLSFGEKFNSAAVAGTAAVHPELILAETDDSPLPITEIIASLSEAAQSDLASIVSANISRILWGTEN